MPLSAAAKRARKQWDQTMAASGIKNKFTESLKPKKRSSGRSVVLSKAMREVDEETRQQVRDARLEALEADNYVEVELEKDDDDMYLEEEEDEPKRKKDKTLKRKRNTAGKQGTR